MLFYFSLRCYFLEKVNSKREFKHEKINRKISYRGIGRVVLLAGCTPTPKAMDTHPASWGNYKCVAFSHSYLKAVGLGWGGATERRARINSIAKCRAHSAQPDSCHIVRCHSA